MPRGHRQRSAARPSQPGVRRGHRPVHRPDPASSRQPVLPRPRPRPPGVHRRHAAHAHRGRGAKAEPASRGSAGERPRGPEDPDDQPGPRGGARLLALPDDPPARLRCRHRPQRHVQGPPGDPGSLRSGSRLPGCVAARPPPRGHAGAPPPRSGGRIDVRNRGRRDGERGARAGPAHAQRGHGPHGRHEQRTRPASRLWGTHHLGGRGPRDAGHPGYRDDPRLGGLRPPRAGVRGGRAAHRAAGDRHRPRWTQGGRVQLRALVSAVRDDSEPEPVLDWRFVALVA